MKELKVLIYFFKVCISEYVSRLLEWDIVISLVCPAYHFITNEHSEESPSFPMFARDPTKP